jgi:hypothetical protein
MSLGDYLRLLRARRGGVTPWDIEGATELPKGLYRQMEQRYRAIGNDESIHILADYYGVPYDDLRWRFDWPRKGLSRALLFAQQEPHPIKLYMWNGDVLEGHVRWWDLGAVGLAPLEGAAELVIVQRHAVDRWDPIAPTTPEDNIDDEEDEDLPEDGEATSGGEV